MKPRATETHRRSRNVQGGGQNLILVAGGALLSTLSIHLGYKLKQVLDTKQTDNYSKSLEGNVKTNERKASGSFHLHSNAFCFPQEEDGFCNHYTGSRNVDGMKPHCNGQMMKESEIDLPLVTVPPTEINKENGVMWSSSPDRLELTQKPFNHSNSSESPCVSESGSDIFSKREVIQKLRQQVKRRDDMIMEMHDQIADLQSSLASQFSHSSHLQSLLDASNRDLFDSEREIQRLRKAIADHCVGHTTAEKTPSVPACPKEGNGHSNGYPKVGINLESSSKVRDDEEKIEMSKREIRELKELMEGKDYLLQNYKEQKSELSIKIKELQHRLDSQLPNIL